MSKVKILGAIASNSGVTLYLSNGEEMNLKKDTQRTKDILDQTVDALARGEHLEIDLSSLSIEKTIEEKTNGVVKFVRGRFSQLKSMFGGTATEPKTVTVVLGSVQRAPDPAPVAKQVPPPIPFNPKREDEPVAHESEELHAIVNDKVIPGVEALAPYMDAINAGEDAVGFQKFMERIATVIDIRSHSIKELLNFMKKGDLPIAEDGSIVAYKVLKTNGSNNGFVDCHSGKVTQRLGSLVQMDEKLVDPNRRNECSTGLHIARRGYLKRFDGNIITLVKVAPEDVIAVPPGEPDKMRAKAYHIVAVLPADVHLTLRANKPMTGHEKASKLLADVIKGNHTPILEVVNIGKAMGGAVTVTPVEGARKLPRAAVGTSGVAKALDDRPANAGEVKANVSILELRKRVDQVEVAKKKTAAQKAAQSGDLAAAISQPATPAPAPAVTPESAKVIVASVVAQVVDEKLKGMATKIGKGTAKPTPEKVEKSKKVVATALTDKNDAYIDAAPKIDKKAAALKLHAEGKSNRAIEAELHICRKTLKKLFDKNGLKPNG
ncbi:hypothetical protein GFL39_26160 [Rhizobium leguminosarum bv. viciae]|uniref:hypothetical protein n=1 Tax=Rhizobium leguminosarum TaxID=384 RepID=UPI00144104A4|nr:hypothetical protein [Rhizobium leguminosarum]NKL08356.1 hypothetical protein [Rhizobium leguminosarum bv. viciae]